VFAVYFQSMYPTVPGGDSGELIVAGCTAGIAHPPGSAACCTCHVPLLSCQHARLLSRPPASHSKLDPNVVNSYPTYTMLAILFYNVIPFGTPAWRVNLVR